jgi:predicted dithiol-disulfide oxidoreductase (DUF899 family)
MPKIKTVRGIENRKVVSEKEWLVARKQLLVKEKKFSKLRDQLNLQRRKLPWVKVEKEYVFDGPTGKVTLADLFCGKSQLIIYHFMFGPGWKEGCPHCSFWADNFNAIGVHLNQRDVTFVAISRAPLAKIEPFKKRMGWSFKWVSSFANDFNYDYQVSFAPKSERSGPVIYNYAETNFDMADREGVSVFYKDDSGTIFHSYSCYARGIDMLNTAYHYLDLVPRGRDEDASNTQSWVRHHDKYE